MEFPTIEEGWYRPFTDEQTSSVLTYFANLGINYQSLVGKDTLDIGAGTASFASGINNRGGRVTSLDFVKGGYGREVTIPADVPYLVHDFMKGVPLPDESFDLIVARASMHAMVKTEEDFLTATREAIRLLKPGGEFRFTPVNHFHHLAEDHVPAWNTLIDKVKMYGDITEQDEELYIKAWPDSTQEVEKKKRLGELTPEERKNLFLEKRRNDTQRLLPGVLFVPIIRDIDSKHDGRKIYESEYYVYKKPVAVTPPSTKA